MHLVEERKSRKRHGQQINCVIVWPNFILYVGIIYMFKQIAWKRTLEREKVWCQMVRGLKVEKKKKNRKLIWKLKWFLKKSLCKRSYMNVYDFLCFESILWKGREKNHFIISMLSGFSSRSQVIKAYTCIRNIYALKHKFTFFEFFFYLKRKMRMKGKEGKKRKHVCSLKTRRKGANRKKTSIWIWIIHFKCCIK